MLAVPWRGRADFSEDRRHRYWLRREAAAPVGWERRYKPGRLLWVMLNPSTADADRNDATMRRVLAFSREWGWLRVDVVNLFSLVSTSPKVLKEEHRHGCATNEQNDLAIINAAHRADRVICAWGSLPFAGAAVRRDEVLNMVGGVFYCLGTTAKGEPVHPLRQRIDARPEAWERP